MYGYHILNLSYFIYFLPFWSQLTNQTSPELLTILTFFIQGHSTLSNLSLVLCMCEVFLITASDMTWSIYHCRPPKPPPLHVMVFIPLLSKKRTDQCKFIQNYNYLLKQRCCMGCQSSSPSQIRVSATYCQDDNQQVMTYAEHDEYNPLCNTTKRLHTGRSVLRWRWPLPRCHYFNSSPRFSNAWCNSYSRCRLRFFLVWLCNTLFLYGHFLVAKHAANFLFLP